jgi:hypothetical protein
LSLNSAQIRSPIYTKVGNSTGGVGTHLAGVDLLAGESVVVGTHLDGVSVGVGVIVEIRDRG